MARAALRQGARAVALANLEAAAKTYPGRDTAALLWLARSIPQDHLASLVYRGSLAGAALAGRLRRAVARARAA